MNTYKINGKEVNLAEWDNSIEDGIYQIYYRNGQLYIEHIIQNNKFHGLDRAWDHNGKLLYEAVWVNNINRTEEFKNNKLAQVVVFGRVIL